jgi:hypothetical protein
MDNKFIYDVKDSHLYSSDGQFLKKVICPKAKYWNQLIADDPKDRSRGCDDCGERVINLEERDASMVGIDSTDCVYIPANSKRVIFLNNENSIPSADKPKRNTLGLPIIKTVRSIRDINRAANMGYWPDVRLIEYKDKETHELINIVLNGPDGIDGPICSKISVGQHTETGRVKLAGDFRAAFAVKKPEPKEWPSFLWVDGKPPKQDDSTGFFREIIPFTYYYPHYQKLPIAAYLIPPDIQNGSEVLVEDPIEDLVGSTWNQGDTTRVMELKGYIKNRRVILDTQSIERTDYVG